MRAMALKLIGIPLRAMPITSPNFPLDPAWTPEMASSTRSSLRYTFFLSLPIRHPADREENSPCSRGSSPQIPNTRLTAAQPLKH